MASINITLNTKSVDLPCVYWIPKLHKIPYKQRLIAGSPSCSTKELSIRLTKILSAVKEGLKISKIEKGRKEGYLLTLM